MTTIHNQRGASVAVEAISDIDSQIAVLQASRSGWVEVLIGSTEGTGAITIDGTKVTFSENNVYSEDIMREGLLPGQVRRCSVLKLDKATVKRLYPSVYETAKENRGRKVSVSK